LKIANYDTEKKVFIIAEIGNNHEGSYTLAEEMIGKAAEAGACAVKFQTIVPEKLVSISQKDRIEQLKRFQLTYDEFERLNKVAKHENILFLSTPFDIESVHFLNSIVPAFKIASGDNNFFPLIEVIAQTGKPIIMSAGLIDLLEVRKTIDFILNIWNENAIDQDIAILHCVTSYPTALEEANLSAIKELQSLNVTIGYSDHTIGTEAAVLSVALGARIVEKHFTIDKNYSDFRDHQLSADPNEFSQLVERVEIASKLLGQSRKTVQESEKLVMEKIRRSIVARKDLDENTVLTLDDISWVRPGGGLAPGNEEMVLGKRLKVKVAAGELITLDNLK
jgi:N-acetylneuraminate synthase/N,N'-diacetyllegionaminate synthase